MKIKWGALVVDGRGKIGGHVASKNKAGNYLRTKTTPTNPQTSAQTSARALFGSISQQWSGLSDAVRLGWNEAVAEWQKTDIFGDLKQVSGKALFQRLNNQAQSAGYPAVTSAPAKAEMVSGVISVVDFQTGSQAIDLTGAYSGSGARLVISATPVLSDGTTFVKNKLRQIITQLGSTYDSGAVYNAYADKFGEPLVGDNIYFSVKYVLANGQASPEQIVKASVTGN